MHRRMLPLPLLLGLSCALLLDAQAGTPAPAKEILDAALKEASTSKKSVFLVFHATWCSWCKRLDAVLNEPEVKRIMDDNYVIVHLDVMERGPMVQTAENPGGRDILKNMGGAESGLPFYVILDGTGKKLIDSDIMPGKSNIGFPGSPEEIAAFEQLLKQTAPHMTGEQRAEVVAHLGVKQ
jgi:thioredoxin-related protein